jgi:hypothetical protein
MQIADWTRARVCSSVAISLDGVFMIRHLIPFAVILLAAACATLSPQSRIENRFVDLGISQDRAQCLGAEIGERLDRREMGIVADYLEGLDRADSARELLEALADIDDSRAATAIARAGIACAF